MNSFKVGDFVQYLMVTDTAVLEVIKVTPKTITVRNTQRGEVLRTIGDGFPVVIHEALSDPEGRVMTLRLRKDGSFRAYNGGHAIRLSDTFGDIPVTRTDYSF